MTFSVSRDLNQTDSFTLCFNGEPDYIIAKHQDEQISPDDFGHGWWIFLQIGVWNNWDKRFLSDILYMLKTRKGEVGLVAVAIYEESAAIRPQIFKAELTMFPSWAIIYKNKVLFENSGLVEIKWLETLLNKLRSHYAPRF